MLSLTNNVTINNVIFADCHVTNSTVLLNLCPVKLSANLGKYPAMATLFIMFFTKCSHVHGFYLFILTTVNNPVLI